MKEKREYFCDYFFGCVFLLVDFLAVVLVVFLFFPVRDLVGFLVEIDLFLRSSVACSRVMVLGCWNSKIIRTWTSFTRGGFDGRTFNVRTKRTMDDFNISPVSNNG